MDQKTEIRRALDELVAAADLDALAVDASSLGPFGLLKACLKEMPRERLAASLPRFERTWLDAIACEAQGQPMAGQVIIASLLPPAPMLQLAGATEAEQAVLRTGATVAIRPPESELLILSPVGPDAAVYVASAAGLTRVAVNVAELVREEVRQALGEGPRIPRFIEGPDEAWNRAALVAGAFLDEPRTQGEVKALAGLVSAWAERTGLPLAYVHMGTTANWEDEADAEEDYESAPAVIGLVLAHAAQRRPAKVSRAELDAPAQLRRIPAELWEEVRARGVAPRDEGLYLAPAGWSVASLFPGDAVYDPSCETFPDAKPLATTCAEDFPPGLRLEPGELPEELWLQAFYA